MSSPRTNNYLKGWHNKLKQITRKAHPNVFKIFKQEQSEQRSQLTRARKLENQDQISFKRLEFLLIKTVKAHCYSLLRWHLLVSPMSYFIAYWEIRAAWTAELTWLRPPSWPPVLWYIYILTFTSDGSDTTEGIEGNFTLCTGARWLHSWCAWLVCKFGTCNNLVMGLNFIPTLVLQLGTNLSFTTATLQSLAVRLYTEYETKNISCMGGVIQSPSKKAHLLESGIMT